MVKLPIGSEFLFKFWYKKLLSAGCETNQITLFYIFFHWTKKAHFMIHTEAYTASWQRLCPANYCIILSVNHRQNASVFDHLQIGQYSDTYKWN